MKGLHGVMICLVAGATAWGSLAGCGRSTPATPSSPSPSPTPVPVPATLADLSATVASAQADRLLNCRDDVFVQVALTNRAATSVLVTGVRRVSRTVSGGCSTSESTYHITSLASPRVSTVVMSGPLYTGGSGCCGFGIGCDGRYTCEFEQTLTVLTALGDVPAGTFNYRVNYVDCVKCPGISAASGIPCPAPAR